MNYELLQSSSSLRIRRSPMATKQDMDGITSSLTFHADFSEPNGRRLANRLFRFLFKWHILWRHKVYADDHLQQASGNSHDPVDWARTQCRCLVGKCLPGWLGSKVSVRVPIWAE
ncbi:unnamed protein product [Protopolystoma xenopodis]|uniref:Uncharacterized protein n=1 Tax=Protopolystoma xenopodis TaxID=117903 RepID=A0A448XA92_9PLAT|nr:unnamed protein product [Protopolystoma xenopodis]